MRTLTFGMVKTRAGSRRRMTGLMLAADVIGLVLAVLLGHWLAQDEFHFGQIGQEELQHVVMTLCFLALLVSSRLYPGTGINPTEEIRLVSQYALASSLIGVVILKLLQLDQPNLLTLLLSGMLGLILVLGLRWVTRIVAVLLGLWKEPVLVVARGEQAATLVRRFRAHLRFGYWPSVVATDAAGVEALRGREDETVILLEDCEVEEFRPVKGTRPLLSDRALLENLFHMAGGPKGRCPDYLPHENQRRLPGKVRVARFRGDRPKLKPGMSLKEAFKLAERPEVSLQVAMLRIGYPHPLLEFGAIIDTPGTDSHVPHHRTLSRSLVRRRRVPVIYCFLSTQPGGIEDRNNIQILLEAGAETMQRVFFVITRKGDIPPPERDELRRHVKKRLDSFRMPVQGLHFIELVNFVDQEFEDLSRQLTEFIKEQQGPQLAAWSHRARDVFRQAQGTATSQLSNLDLEEKARARREAECAKRVHDLEAVSAAVSESREWGAPYARRRYDDGTGRPCSTIDEKIGELRHRSLFDGFNEVLDGDVATLNSGASRVIRGALGALHSKLTSEMGELHVDAPARFTVDEEQFFDASAAITAAERVDFSAWDAWWDGLSYGPQVEKARGSIARPWATAKGEGLEKSRKALENGIRHYKNEVNRALSKARRELEATKRMDPEAQERLRQRLKAARDLGKNWVKRFSDWERKYADQGSKS